MYFKDIYYTEKIMDVFVDGEATPQENVCASFMYLQESSESSDMIDSMSSLQVYTIEPHTFKVNPLHREPPFFAS